MSLGEISFQLGDEPAGTPRHSLERATDIIQESAVWYEDVDNVAPGTWVQFEALMNYATPNLLQGRVETNGSHSLVFWHPNRERRIGLVLHGTADGLLAGQYHPIDMSNPQQDSTGTFVGFSEAYHFVHTFFGKHSGRVRRVMVNVG
jgi:hypothetical protein